MSKLDWFKDAAEAFEAAAKLPQFPGDPSPIEPLLEKLVNKLYGECWNGGAVGLDGCPVCRAHRTEAAEASEAKVKDALAKVTDQAVGAEAQVEQLTDVANVLGAKVAALAKQLALATERAELAEMRDDEATKQRDEALLERAEAQKHVVDLSARLEAAESEGKLYYDRFMDLRTALRELA